MHAPASMARFASGFLVRMMDSRDQVSSLTTAEAQDRTAPAAGFFIIRAIATVGDAARHLLRENLACDDGGWWLYRPTPITLSYPTPQERRSASVPR
jgi:hypothetical protein